ncbi:MAG: formimidoylglutamate deiminase [Rhodobacterales bacterium]|jgi:formimidoylglutamate deiminase|tara:strand:- start:2713 stop:4074 length:1362 start_codon:yes stop_codon:yes gene_type:complete
MTKIFASKILTSSGWKENITVEINADGHIEKLRTDTKEYDHHVGCLLPAPVNAHSHSFQRAMSGLTEYRGPNPKDSFWTWRKLMFKFLKQLDPDIVEAIAAFVQMEMLEAGFSTNVEFHYLHHSESGRPYDDIAEMSQRIISAANQSGIGLTLLPVFYQYGGCDLRALEDGQRRFGNNLDQFQTLFQRVSKILETSPPDTFLGLAPHSLRAVDPKDLIELVNIAEKKPIHMHLAEQVAEVDEVKEFLGARPVEWVMENLDISNQWCMIHCTQMEPHEVKMLAKTQAVAGLCPITESSLGDGIFEGANWMSNNGNIAIGSDSNVRISLSEELRTLEYSQRLRDRSRAVLANSHQSTGRRLFEGICKGGAQAAGRKTGLIKEGYLADLLALNTNHVDLERHKEDTLLDSYIFSGDDRMISDVWSAGRHLVKDGEHILRTEITRAYKKATKKLTGF